MPELVSVSEFAERSVRVQIEQRARRNALSREVIAALQETVESIHENVRFIVISGEGPEAFCAGADRKVLGTVDEQGAIDFIGGLHRALAAIRQRDQVTIAAVRGHCIGAGLELAASCDFRVADTTARFSMPEVLVGIPSVVEAALLPRLIGWGTATDWLLTGRTVEVAEARSAGLLQRVADEGQLEDAVHSLIKELAQACPRAIAMQKQLLRVWEEQPLSAAIEAGVSALGRAYRPHNGVIEAHRRLN